MLLTEVANALILVWSHKTSRICVSLIVFVSLLLSIFFSIFASVIILACYLSGCIVSFCLVKYQYEVSFCLCRLASIYHGHISPKKIHEKGCNICDNINCTRHNSNDFSKEPWKDIIISNELNQSIESFFEKIFENFITSWYNNLTDDDSFVNELKVSVRYATSTIYNRYAKIDLGELVACKLIPCAIKHIHDCLKINDKSPDKNKLDKVAATYLGKRLHAAVTTRENELSYLRNLTILLLPHILPKTQFNCRNYNILIREILAGWVLLPMMDIIADPNILNLLVNITFSYKKRPTKKVAQNKDDKVEYLCHFVNYADVKNAALGYDLTRILKSPNMLYAFMQFLKEEGPVNLLQFCLDVEEFNKKLLTPEITKIELEKLHKEATQIYERYMKENSNNSIGCTADVRNNMFHLLQAGPANIVKLRTSTPLYKSYDYAFNILESKWLPLFYHSDEFYKLVCGSRISSNYQKTSISRYAFQIPGSPIKFRNKKFSETNQGTVAKISSSFNKIKGALRAPQPIDGAKFQDEHPNYENEPTLFIEPTIYRDLSTWRVSISHVEQITGSKLVVIFYVNVKRIDACSESERSWTVQRYDQDFYTLKLKLVEFHGENEICDSPLPSRRSSTPIETRRQKYEEFLQKLLQKPMLRGSDLLHTFLTTEQNFTLLADNSLPIVTDLGNIYQSVAHKLRKEKGQHLDPFMTTFLQSTENEKSKLGKFDSPDVADEADSGILVENSQSKPRHLTNNIFGNNFSVTFPDETTHTQMAFVPKDIIQCFSYLLINIFNIPQGVLRLFLAICNVARNAVAYFARIIIEHQIKSNLSQHTLAHLIDLLKDVLFIQKFTPPTKFDLEQREHLAFSNLSKMKRGLVSYWLGIEVNKGLTTILNILQCPQLNKQLAYSLLDIIIMELYPDCNLNEMH